MSTPKLYTYNLNPVKEIQIKGICNARGYIFSSVPHEHQNLQISSLISGNLKPCSGNCFTEEMMLLVDFEGDTLDKLLSDMREQKVEPVKYKAVLTEFNSKLTSYQLFGQLKREAAKIKEKLNSNN